MTDKITIERETLERVLVALEYAYSADDEMVQESIKYLRAALAQKAEPDGQEAALQKIADFGQDQLREPRTQEEKEQYAFEDWLASECPSGDVESVQRQWEESAEYLELQDATPAQPAEPDMRHPKIQSLIGSRARCQIELQLVEQLLEDPHFETTSMDMEHWGPMHDKLKAILVAAAQSADYAIGYADGFRDACKPARRIYI